MVLGLLFLIFGTGMITPRVYASASTGTVAAGSSNGYVYVYDEAGTLLWSYVTGADVASVAVSSDGVYVAVGSRGNKLYLFDRDGTKLWEKAVPIAYGGNWMGEESKSVAISAHGEYVVAGATDNLYVYRKDGTLHWSHAGKETSVGIAPNGNYIVASEKFGDVHLFSIASSTPLWTKSISAFWVATSNPGYVAASSGSTVYLYEAAGTQIWSYSHSKWVGSDYIRVDMSQDGLSVVAVNDDPSDSPGTVLCYWNHLKDGTSGWSSADGTPVWDFDPLGGPGDTDFYSVAISGNGDIIATGPSYGSFVFSRTSNVPLQTFSMGTGNSYDLTFDGQFGACGNRQGELYYFSKDSSTPLWSKTIGGKVHAVALVHRVIDMTYGCAPTVDGVISAGEYDDANSLNFATSGGSCTVYFKHNTTALFVAFDVPNLDADSGVQVFVDTEYDRASVPQTDDYRFTIARRLPPDEYGENNGTGTDWTPWDPTLHGWTGAHQDLASTWNAEFAISYERLGITAGVAKTIGIMFYNAWTSTGDHHWPTGADWMDPSTWGTAYSSDNWAAKYTLTITTTTGGTTSPSPGTHTYTQGTVVTVTAIPYTDYEFNHWELDGSNAGPPYQIDVTMDSDHTLHAVFEYSPPPPVGGVANLVDKLGLLAPYIGLTSTIAVATVATAIYVKRVKRRKKKQ